MGIKPSFDGLAALASSPGVTRKSLTKFEADFSNRCESPVSVSLFARPEQVGALAVSALPVANQKRIDRETQELTVPKRSYDYEVGRNTPIGVDLQVRCRKCAACLRTRALLWSYKAQEEIRAWPRTWFATFTASPQQHWEWEMEASVRRRDASLEFVARTDLQRFDDICAVAGPALTRYVKRVRKIVGGPLRYFLVAERHASGLPHWHALVHEVDPSKPIRKAVLKGQWPHGFSTFKLVENPGAAWYLCKYLSKDIGTRVRASLRYGSIPTSVIVRHGERDHWQTYQADSVQLL